MTERQQYKNTIRYFLDQAITEFNAFSEADKIKAIDTVKQNLKIDARSRLHFGDGLQRDKVIVGKLFLKYLKTLKQ